MTEFITVFENEEAAKLLDYFITYKKMISRKENKKTNNKNPSDEVTVGLLTQPEVVTIK